MKQGGKTKSDKEKKEIIRAIVADKVNAEDGVGIKDICKKHGISRATFYLWQKQLDEKKKKPAKFKLEEARLDGAGLLMGTEAGLLGPKAEQANPRKYRTIGLDTNPFPAYDSYWKSQIGAKIVGKETIERERLLITIIREIVREEILKFWESKAEAVRKIMGE